jgi:hypothetical protein
VITVLFVSHNAFSTTNPTGTKLERLSACCMVLILPEWERQGNPELHHK